MKHTLKKALSVTLCLCLMSFVLAFGSAAYGGVYLMLGTTEVTEENMSDIFGDGTAKFVPEKRSGTLYLIGAEITGENTAIYCDSSLTVVLSGKNTVKANGNGVVNGIAADEDLTFKGDGELTVELSRNLGDFDSCLSYGIVAYGKFSVESGKISVIVNDATGLNGEDATIGGIFCNEFGMSGGELSVEAGDALASNAANAVTRAIITASSAEISGGSLTASCGKAVGYADWNSGAFVSLDEGAEWLSLSGEAQLVSPKDIAYGDYELLDENGKPATLVKIGEKTYTVSFDTDGGSEIESKQVKKNDAVLAGVEAPVKDGFKFIGWKNGETDVAENDTFADLSNGSNEITLTAVWEEAATPEQPEEKSDFAQFMTVLAMLLKLVFKLVMMVTGNAA